MRTAHLPLLELRGVALTPISLSQEGTTFVAVYEQLIDVWAGRTSFMLKDGDAEQWLTLDIGPNERKVGLSAWEDLLEELSTVSANLPWGMSPGQASGRLEPDALSAVHPAIIENQLPTFLNLLRRIVADPPSASVRVRTVSRLSLSRAVDRKTVLWLSRRPLELVGVMGKAPAGYSPNSQSLVDQPSVLRSLDHPVTRYIIFLTLKVRKRLVFTRDKLRSTSGHGVPDPSVIAYARLLSKKVDTALTALDGIVNSNLFRVVPPSPPTDSVLQSLPDHPLYSAIHRVGRHIAEPGLAYAPGQDIYSALKHSYDLFELLVLYRLVAAIEAALASTWKATKEAPIEQFPFEDRPADRSLWSWTGPCGERLELIYQARFQPARKPPDQRRYASLSSQAVPDYILAFWKDGELVSWLILDAKYRSGRQPIQEGLGELHRYRDALRLSSHPASGAYIIVPNLQEGATLYGEQEYQSSHNFGAINVYNKSWFQQILAWYQSSIDPSQ
ncbi:nuclease domain-containing protein [Fulvimarina sp. 2208YS6-2-32]|uniref:nuclease domain-containing protein n=1 Tax=Fulvimarina uroteuthidis TaxID=3098149 RepID=UPI002AC91FA2|nr:nuclease domain-containing protein [Fulvimarina sp. 2208YS6-2-32]